MTTQMFLTGISQSHGFAGARRIIDDLPALPSIIRYLDEYDDDIRSIRTCDDEWRSQVVQPFQKRQDGLRTLMEKADKSSKTNLSIQLEKTKRRVAELEQHVETLTASHKAMILAVGQIGGMSAWQENGRYAVSRGRQAAFG